MTVVQFCLLIFYSNFWCHVFDNVDDEYHIRENIYRPIVIKSIAMIKKAAAIVHTKNKDIDKKLSRAIIKAGRCTKRYHSVVYIFECYRINHSTI